MTTLQQARDLYLYNGIVADGFMVKNGKVYYDIVESSDPEDLTPTQMKALKEWSGVK